MSAVAPVPFIGGAALSRSRNFDAERCINLYPEGSTSGQSKSIAMLVGTPGLKLITALSAPGFGVRGMIRFSISLSFVVVGGNVYAMTSAFVSSLIGTIAARLTPVSMASNGVQIMMMCGAEGYVITPNTITPSLSTIAQIVSAPFLGADRVDFIDQYLIFNKPNTGQFQITGLLNTNISALDFATAEGSPDNLVSLIVNQSEIWLFGETTTEIWFDSGAAFPFQRIQGAFIEQGCSAKNSLAKADSSVFWLSSDDRGQGMAMRSQGYTPVRISTHAQEFAWAQYSSISDAIAFTYQQEGHVFYQLTFPTGNATWVYDTTTQLWHEKAWRDPFKATLNRHRAQCQMAFGGKLVVGDWENGNLFELNLDTYTDNGDPLPAIRQAPHFATETNTNNIFDRFWIDLEAGVGINGNSVASGSNYLLLPGSAGNYASTPNAAANRITGDIDCMAYITPTNWTLGATAQTIVSKWTPAANQRAWLLQLNQFGNLHLENSSDGTANLFAESTTPPAISGGIWVRATLQVNDGSGNHVYKFYTSTQSVTTARASIAWVQLGATQTVVGTTAIFASSSPLAFGMRTGTVGDELFTGRIAKVYVLNGIGGTLAVSMVADDTSVGSVSWVSAGTGETYTVNGTASIASDIVLATIGIDPQVIVEWSDDGGHTFPIQRLASMGKIGEYSRRAIVKRAGRSRDRVWRTTITDPVKRVLIGAGASVRACSS